MELAEFLLKNKSECNGHKQMEISSMSIEDGMQLLEDLSDICEDKSDVFFMQLFSDGSFDIYQSDYWDSGEHPLGHTDRLILSVDNQ